MHLSSVPTPVPTLAATRNAEGRSAWVVVILAAVVAGAPMLATRLLPSIDYLNHAARLWVLARYDEVPALREFYVVHWAPIPNIGLDLLVTGLARWAGAPPLATLRDLTLLLTAATIPIIALLQRVLFGRPSAWSAAALLFLPNYVLLYGFLNYVAGVNLALLGVACWAGLRPRRRAAACAVSAGFAVLLFFAHLYALGLYGLMLLGLEAPEAWRRREPRRLAVLLLPFLPAAALLAASPVGSNAAAARTLASDMHHKLMGLYSVVDMGHPAVAAVTALGFGAAVAYGMATRRLRLHGRAPVLLAAFALAFLAMPFTLLGSGFADYRLPIAGVLLFLGVTRWEPVPRRFALPGAALLAAIALLRAGVFAGDCAAADHRYAAIMQALRPVAPGSRVLGAIAAEDANGAFLRHPPLDHAPTLAVIARAAFVPTLFAEPEKQPLLFAPGFVGLARQDAFMRLYDHPADDPAHPLGRAATAPYDYVVLFARLPLRAPLPPQLRRVDDRRTPDVSVWQVLHGGG